MKRTFLNVAKISSTVLLGFSLAILTAILPSFADPDQQLLNPADSELNNSLYSGGSFNPLELINRAKLGEINVNQQDINDNLDAAAMKFRNQQNTLLQNPQKQNLGQSITTPQELHK